MTGTFGTKVPVTLFVKRNGRMKKNSKKIIITAAIVLLVVIIAVVTVLLIRKNSNKSYRVIKLEEYEGQVEVKRKNALVDLFSGLQLVSGDESTTGEESWMTLLIDSDKHMSVTPNTIFDIKAAGSEESGNVSIDVKEGKAVFDIESKLGDSSVFEVHTPNATTSIRGTTFTTSYNPEENETHIFVNQGKVEVSYGDGKSVEVNENEAATVINDTAKIEKAGKHVLLERQYDYTKQDYINNVIDDYQSYYLDDNGYVISQNFADDVFESIFMNHSDEEDAFFKNQMQFPGYERNKKDITYWFPNEFIADAGNGPELFKTEAAFLTTGGRNINDGETVYTRTYTPKEGVLCAYDRISIVIYILPKEPSDS